ncbi:chromosome segregation protein Csm1/Pcs1-domain-containing protein [Protomyces lactucae-debilis]|uniref:Chromosome segregation protein Csm1/Pcs1-domain-containing protein n=1 Tax=Protomyces lactucae-debilis TaxID=2754530 RepID=A0A1Y2FJF5_PROLT|nr:chromosome segregation protein Csm1/Pcs1-domain-containing protein [Protomyces lactucae-debilis]ORY83727.1 chromosome segregation protein Csm1/Pcs1-domain-containing protein [Protomyces lactucae-debilis]
MKSKPAVPSSPAASDASGSDVSGVCDYDTYKEAVEAQFEQSQEVIETLESQVTRSAREISRLKAALDKAQRQVATLTGKLDARGQTQQVPLLKEEIYQDLTGLVIQSVSREDDETVFSCLQTGRNGTFHYKLAWPKARDEQITFTPMLDAERDVDLSAVLPDYLTEQIMFAQDQASLFAYRLWTAIQKK